MTEYNILMKSLDDLISECGDFPPVNFDDRLPKIISEIDSDYKRTVLKQIFDEWKFCPLDYPSEMIETIMSTIEQYEKMRCFLNNEPQPIRSWKYIRGIDVV